MTWVTFIATEKNTNGSIYENIILLLTTKNMNRANTILYENTILLSYNPQ